MRANRRLQPAMLILTALLLFGTLNGGPGPAGSGTAGTFGRWSGRPDAVVGAHTDAALLTAPAGLAGRLLAEARVRPAPLAPRHGGFSAPGASGSGPGRSGRRAAAAVERAAHPERRSGTRLRGPPGLSV